MAGGALAKVPNPLPAVADLNLRLCFPELTEEDRRRLVRRVLAENGATVLEMSSIWRWPADKLRRLENGVEGLDLQTIHVGAARRAHAVPRDME